MADRPAFGIPERLTDLESIRVEWRATTDVLPGWSFAVRDADGNLIGTVTALSIHASAGSVTWAELTMYRDINGSPIMSGDVSEISARWVMGDDGPATGVFPFHVASMSVVP